jgi:capsular exopolysaccharide synthesis family protein
MSFIIAGKQKDRNDHILLPDIQSKTTIESYRVLRSNLLNIQKKQGIKTLLVTSAVAGEGKTTTAINLAMSLKQAGQKVLLVDGSFRKGNIAERLGFSQENQGLTDVLKREASLASAVAIAEKYDDLAVLPKGTSDEFTSDDMDLAKLTEVFNELKAEYDWVIVDSAPASFSDTALMAGAADGILLCIRQYASAQDEVKQAVRQLENAGGQVVGTVMTRVDLKVEDTAKRLYSKQY